MGDYEYNNYEKNNRPPIAYHHHPFAIDASGIMA
jgi:hypothetical protein